MSATLWLIDYFGDYSRISFVQVGSHVGATYNDPLYPLLTNGYAKGILIEPLPRLFDQLCENYKDVTDCVFENIAISNYDGFIDIFYVDTEDGTGHSLPEWADQLGSVRANHAAAHFSHFSPQIVAGLNVRKMAVPCLTLASLCTKHAVESIDLLHIDAEGHEFEIVTSLELGMLMPQAILFEHTHIDGPFERGEKYIQCCDFLKARNYRLREADSGDPFLF